MVNSMFVSWILTIAFAATGMWFLLGRARRTGSAPPTAVDRISDLIHVLVSVVMIVMIWPWGARVPVWPQAVAFVLAACWFLAPVVSARFRPTPQPQGLRWSPHVHHATMAIALVWMILTMPGAASMDPGMPGPGGDDAMSSAMAAASVDPLGATEIINVVLAAYFLLSALPLLSAVRAGRNDPGRRHRVLDAASHATMSVGMAALLLMML
jgi:hypothetical protein